MKLCECGCGGPAPIAKMTRRSAGHVKGEPMRFISGHTHRGRPKSEEQKRKTAAALRGRKRPYFSKDLHPLWVAQPSPSTIHKWLLNNYPKTGRCVECGTGGRTEHAFLRHPEPHTRNRDDYRELCPTCHRRLDAAQYTRTECKRGHILAGENLIVLRNGSRQCRTCTRARAREWYARKKQAAA